MSYNLCDRLNLSKIDCQLSLPDNNAISGNGLLYGG